MFVTVPVKSIKLRSFLGTNGHTSAADYANGQKVTFEEGDKRKFICNVTGSYPAPIVDIFIGNKNITDLFEKKEVAVSTGNEKASKTWPHRVTLTNKSLEVDYSFNRKTLTCTAKMPTSKFAPVNISIDIQLKGCEYIIASLF